MTTTADSAISVADVVKRQFDALNRHDAAAAAAHYAPDATVLDPQYPDPLRGRDAIARDFAEFFAAFPDLRVTPVRTLESGDECAVEFTMRGTHKGPLLGPGGHVPATNRSIDVRGCVCSRIDREGRVADERRYYDLAALLTQIGLMQ